MQTTVAQPTTPVKNQDDVKVKTNSSISERVSKMMCPIAYKFFRNRKRTSRKLSNTKQNSTVVDDSSPTTLSNIATIGGDINDNDNEVKVSESEISQEENQGIEMTNSEDILKVIRSLIRCLDSPIVKLRENSKKNLQDFLEKVDKAMETMRVENHKVPSDEILAVLDASLQIVTKSVPSTSSSQDSISLRMFLWTLRSILIVFSTPALDAFKETVDEKLRELDGQDKIISIERICRSLDPVLAFATS